MNTVHFFRLICPGVRTLHRKGGNIKQRRNKLKQRGPTDPVGPQESVKAFLGWRAVLEALEDASRSSSTRGVYPFPALHPCHNPLLPVSRSPFLSPQGREEEGTLGRHGGLDPADQGVRIRGARAGGLRLPQLLDELPGRQGPQKVQGVLPHHVRDPLGEQGRQALQLRAEGPPELARDDAPVLRHASSRRPAAPDHRRRTGVALHGREVLLLQGLLYRYPGQPSQDWGSQLPGNLWADPLHGIIRHQPGYQGNALNSVSEVTFV